MGKREYVNCRICDAVFNLIKNLVFGHNITKNVLNLFVLRVCCTVENGSEKHIAIMFI